MNTNISSDLFNINVLYQDNEILVVEKPAGLPVHKNDFMVHDAPYLTKIAGMITGRRIFNVHRLDAKTSGLIIMTFSSDSAAKLAIQFERREVIKKYLAIVRGNPGEGSFTGRVLVKKKNKIKKEAVTNYKTLESVFTDISCKERDNIILSLVEVTPETGRWHQIRQHFAINRFDIVGDSHHGDFTLNKIIADITGIKRMLFHASYLRFLNPETNQFMEFYSSPPGEFRIVMDKLKIQNKIIDEK